MLGQRLISEGTESCLPVRGSDGSPAASYFSSGCSSPGQRPVAR